MPTLTITIAEDITIAELDDMTTAIMTTASFWKEDIVTLDCDMNIRNRTRRNT